MFEVLRADHSPLSDDDKALFYVAKAIVNNFPDAVIDRDWYAYRGLFACLNTGLISATQSDDELSNLLEKLSEAIMIVSLYDVAI